MSSDLVNDRLCLNIEVIVNVIEEETLHLIFFFKVMISVIINNG